VLAAEPQSHAAGPQSPSPGAETHATEPESPPAGGQSPSGGREDQPAAREGASAGAEDPQAASAADAALLAALRRPRYEVLPLHGVADAVSEHLPPGSKVTLTASPTKGLDATLTLAEQLAPRGYATVPHLSARLVRDRAHLEEIVARLRAIDIDEVFVIAGDARHPAGEYEGAAELLTAMGELRTTFTDIGISGYPESHHFISDETTIEAMFAKAPMATYIVSQICFDADVIATWARRVRDRGTHLPIWVGVPGAVDARKLLRTSLRIGLGQSARFLRAQHGLLRRFLAPRQYAPTDLLRALGPTFADPGARVGGIHVYTFNELKRTETWRRQLVDRLTN
jgi:methylenetetrahydrofolate reductase (NADPH)